MWHERAACLACQLYPWLRKGTISVPFLVMGYFLETPEGTECVKKCGITCDNICRNHDTAHVCPFAFPIFVHERILFQRPDHILLLVSPCMGNKQPFRQDGEATKGGNSPRSNPERKFQKAVCGIPPRHNISRYKSPAPSRGAMHFKCGGCVAAMNH